MAFFIKNFLWLVMSEVLMSCHGMKVACHVSNNDLTNYSLCCVQRMQYSFHSVISSSLLKTQ
jgi:hypothetical protein